MLPMIKIKIANPKTCWWANTKGRWRNDTLIGIQRHYNRNYKVYVYRLIIGRLTIGVMFGKN